MGQTTLQQYHTILHAEDAEQSRALSWPRADTLDRAIHLRSAFQWPAECLALTSHQPSGAGRVSSNPSTRTTESRQKTDSWTAQLEKKSCPSIAVELTTQTTGRHAGWLAVTSFADRSHAPSGSDQPEDVPVRVRLQKGIALSSRLTNWLPPRRTGSDIRSPASTIGRASVAPAPVIWGDAGS
jgi:hypothetical protein